MKRFLVKAYRWEYFFLVLIVVVSLALHFGIISQVKDLILDEQHYVKDARVIISEHQTDRPEHPPLGKLMIVAGMEIFGDNPWGWRFFPIMFGTVTVVLFYFLCRRLDLSRETASIATFLLAFENLTFLQGSVAMLDVFFLTFMMAAFLLYMSRQYIASGFGIGLSALAKLDGALAAPIIFIHWLFSRQRRNWWFFLAAFFAVFAFVELMIPLDYIITRTFHNLADPLHRIQTMLQLTSSLTFANVTHPNLERPWAWLITYNPMAYWIMPHYTAAISFSIWGLAFPSVGYMVYKAIKRSEAALFGLSWFFGTWGVMSILSVLTNRASYPYYFYCTVGSICIGVAIFIGDLLSYFRRKQYG
ncbi:MAG TPA: phospholipid carrier-dependent glycosyltransferase, partial [Dehalococcoidales bacterium]|nr:phospholipid carrier-dependent glycosyltransferase [Dehalococcoidales bacterium]